MITISTKDIGIGMMDIGSNLSKGKAKNSDDNMDSFADIMNLSTNVQPADTNLANAAKGVDVNKELTRESSDYDVDKANKYEDSYNKSSADTNKTTDTSKQNSVKNDAKKEVTNTSTDDKDDEVTIEDVEKIISDLIELITTELGVTEEELKGALDQAGLDMLDLLDADTMEQFVLSMQDASKLDILIDEELAKIVNETSEGLEDIISSINEKTDVNTFVDEAKKIENNNSDDEIIENQTNEVTNFANVADKVNESDNDSSNNMFDRNKDGGRASNNETNSTITNLNQAIDQAFENLDSVGDVASSEIYEADIVRQIIDNIKTNITRTTTSLEVVLNPESLGKVSINVSEKDGVMQAKIIAETEAAKNAIEASLANLKEAFDNQDLKVEAIEVLVGTFESFEQQTNEGEEEASSNATASKNINLSLDGDIEGEELTEQEILQAEMMRMSGNRVNYSI